MNSSRMGWDHMLVGIFVFVAALQFLIVKGSAGKQLDSYEFVCVTERQGVCDGDAVLMVQWRSGTVAAGRCKRNLRERCSLKRIEFDFH